MPDLSDLIKVDVNGQHTFFLDQMIMSRYSGKFKKMMKQERRKPQIMKSEIGFDDFPCGADGFELVSRFCYNGGRIKISTSNVCLLHCSAMVLEMTDEVSPCNLIQQTETFLEGLFYWTWSDILISLKSCDGFFQYADSSGILEKLICSLLSKITHNSDFQFNASWSSSSSSPETINGFKFFTSNQTTPDSKAWWFDDLTILSPKIVVKVIKVIGAYGADNNSLILTKFILHYLKTALHNKNCVGYESLSKSCSMEYAELADTAVHGMALMGKTGFSCRGLFWVLRVVSDLGLSKSCRVGLERLIGGMLDKATLDDLLVPGHSGGGGVVYDVNLVLRLIRVFVSSDGVTMQRMKRIGRLIDKYLREISPDQYLKVSKFLAVAESLPDCARDSFDGVYRSIDIYIESHPKLSFDERSRLCRCLNYEKLTLEACKDLAKNPRIPPRTAIQALMSQQTKSQKKVEGLETTLIPSKEYLLESPTLLADADADDNCSEFSEESEEMKLHIQKMQCRVFELEKVCKEMRGQMIRLLRENNVTTSPALNRAAVPRGPRLC
ncbi:hypothetical protein Scep_015996 [Stephania cephalantha]|uniref:NPH3 domain-containing protein n=1 Tax=Stephania cephalantha TaxID=152367 RepID=A0AAP0IMZ4_9MAGN